MARGRNSSSGYLKKKVRRYPSRSGPVARLAAEARAVLEIGHCLVNVAHGLGQEAKQTIDR